MGEFIKRNVFGAASLSLLLLTLLWLAAAYFESAVFRWHEPLLRGLCIMGIAGLMTYMVGRFSLYKERSHWLMVCYVTLVGVTPFFAITSKAFPSAFLATLALYFLLKFANEQETRSCPFMVAICLTCASLLYYPALVLFVPFFISFLRIAAKLTIKDVAAFLGGVFVPLFFTVFFLWLLGYDLVATWEASYQVFLKASFGVAFFEDSLAALLLCGTLALFVLLALIKRLTTRTDTSKVTVSGFFEFLYMVLLVGVPVLLFYPTEIPSFSLFILMPVAFIITSFFSEMQNKKVRYFCLTLFVLVLGFYYACLLSPLGIIVDTTLGRW